MKIAKEDLSRLELSQPARTAKSSAAIDDVSDNGLINYLESLLSKLDTFVKCVDVLSEVCSAF